MYIYICVCVCACVCVCVCVCSRARVWSVCCCVSFTWPKARLFLFCTEHILSFIIIYTLGWCLTILPQAKSKCLLLCAPFPPTHSPKKYVNFDFIFFFVLYK